MVSTRSKGWRLAAFPGYRFFLQFFFLILCSRFDPQFFRFFYRVRHEKYRKIQSKIGKADNIGSHFLPWSCCVWTTHGNKRAIIPPLSHSLLPVFRRQFFTLTRSDDETKTGRVWRKDMLRFISWRRIEEKIRVFIGVNCAQRSLPKYLENLNRSNEKVAWRA